MKRAFHDLFSISPYSTDLTDHPLIPNNHTNTTHTTLSAKGLETTCSKNNTHGLVTMNQAGKIYLVIISEGGWIVQVQY